MLKQPPSAPHVTVLHIRNGRLPRTQREGLGAIGVEVEPLDTQDITDALHAEEVEGDADRLNETLRRITEAEICVIDEGTGLKFGALILRLRQQGEGATWTTLESLGEVADGLNAYEARSGRLPARCEFVRKGHLLDKLRGLGVPREDVQGVARLDSGEVTRPPRPLPYVEDPNLFSKRELDRSHYEYEERLLLSGKTPPRGLLEVGVSSVEPMSMSAAGVLWFLVRYLPTEELGRLDSEHAVRWWTKVIQETGEPRQEGEDGYNMWSRDIHNIKRLLWHAIARDGGRQTLARLPESLSAMRDEVRGEWAAAVAEVGNRLPMELMSAGACAQPESTGVRVVKEWCVVPCEDPLAPDADPNLYQPTLTTLSVASRYRSPAETLRLAIERWGTRPYLNKDAATQVERFIRESPPATREELSDWIRLLSTLPIPGRFRALVLEAMRDWPTLYIDLANADAFLWEQTRASVWERIPVFTKKGWVTPATLSRLTNAEHRKYLRDNAPTLSLMQSARLPG